MAKIVIVIVIGNSIVDYDYDYSEHTPEDGASLPLCA